MYKHNIIISHWTLTKANWYKQKNRFWLVPALTFYLCPVYSHFSYRYLKALGDVQKLHIKCPVVEKKDKNEYEKSSSKQPLDMGLDLHLYWAAVRGSRGKTAWHEPRKTFEKKHT